MPLEDWIERQYRNAGAWMLQSISPVHLEKTRRGFGQVIHPRAGAVVASPVPADYDPDPDYFFHWFRDSALVIDALRLLHASGALGPAAIAHFSDFVRFSRRLNALDGRALVSDHQWRQRIAPGFERYVRGDAELAAVHGAAVCAESRVNADGTLDISRWSRPQHDGPPLRALAVLRWIEQAQLDAETTAEAAALLRADLQFTLEHWHRPAFDIWEEEEGEHYYTLCISRAALQQGALWLEACGEVAAALQCRSAADSIRTRLDDLWLPEAGYYRSRRLASGRRSTKELDISVILAAIHTAARSGPHSAGDARMQATLDHLHALFDGAYAINRERAADRAPAMGRYAGDMYYSGGAYFFATLGAAEFCFRAAAAGADARTWMRRGDAFLATVRAYIGPDGQMSEQFDRNSGTQTSARHLAWSYASYISSIAARRTVAAGL